MRNPIVQGAATLVAATLIALVLAGCGGGGDGTTAPPPPAGNVGPAGATVASADGNATLVVPPGALNTTITATLKPATPADGYTDDPQIVPGTVYQLDAPETALAVPAALSIALPASAAASSTSNRSRAHIEAIVPTPGFIACYLAIHNVDTPDTLIYFPVVPGQDVTNVPSGASEIQCIFDYHFYVSAGPNAGCPAGWDFRFNDFWTIPSYFTPSNPVTLGSNAGFPDGTGFITACVPTPPSTPNVVSLGGARILLGNSPVHLSLLNKNIFAFLNDSTPPVVQTWNATLLPAPNGMVTVHLALVATDNVGITKVVFSEKRQTRASTLVTSPFSTSPTTLATYMAPPYVWDSAPMTPDQARSTSHSYTATAYDAGGNRATVSSMFTATAPSISSFVASPTTLPVGGGDVVLSWTTPAQNAPNYADTLSIDQGVGDVTGTTSRVVHVTATTTFTLTGVNPSGSGSATVTVTVAPPPAPSVTSFSATPTSLPAGGGNVTLAWATSGASTLAIDHGIGTVSGDSGSVVANVTASTPFTLTATNASGSVASTVVVTVAANADRFVSAAAGSDANDCSQPSPCKSIAKAMTGATSGATVFLAPGLYTPATQGNGATIPDGVALKSSTAGAATLADGVTLTVAGSSAINGIVLDTTNFACGVITASGTTGTPTLALTGVLIKCLGAVNIGGNVSAVMTPGALANATYTAALPGGFGAVVSVAGTAQLTIQGGIIDGNGLGSPAFGGGFLAVAGSSTLTLSGVTLRNRTGTGIGLAGTSNLVVNNNSLIDAVGLAGNCPTASAIVIAGTNQVTLDHSQISNGGGSAICVRGSTTASTVTVTQSTITHMGNGIAAEIGTGSTAVVTITGSSFTNNARGIFWNGFAVSSFDISGSTFTGNTVTGIDYEGFGSLKLRNSNVSSNTGQGVWLITNPIADLGTQADPGGNTFTGNTSTGLQMNVTTTSPVQAVGNTWNANVQGADAAGHYSPTLQKTGPASGTNYGISNAGVVNL